MCNNAELPAHLQRMRLRYHFTAAEREAFAERANAKGTGAEKQSAVSVGAALSTAPASEALAAVAAACGTAAEGDN